MKEAVDVAKEEWQEGVELENRKKVELALQEQQAVWDKRYTYYYPSGCRFSCLESVHPAMQNLYIVQDNVHSVRKTNEAQLFFCFFRLELEKAQAVASAKEQLSEELAETRRRLEEEEHRQQTERRKGGGSDGEDTSSRKGEEEWEREKERAVDEAVKQARAMWMEEREK